MRVIAIAAMLACRSEPEHPIVIEETKPMTPSPEARTSCADILRALVVDGNLSGGRGLSPDVECGRAEVERAFGSGFEEGHGALSNTQRSWLKWRLGGDTVARAWFDGDRVILVDVAHPNVRESPDALTARLGEPSTTLPARNNPTHKDRVYVDRGLTITVGGLYETPPNPHVSYLFIYAPTTLDDYVGRLGGKDEWVRRFPIRR
jgi:hypothetical protein